MAKACHSVETGDTIDPIWRKNFGGIARLQF
jgi:hypothetical protein